VVVVDLATTFNVTGTINLVNGGTALDAASTLVLSPTGGKLLVFGAAGEHVDTLVVIDTAAAKTTPATAATQIGGFDRPVSAVFSSDGSKAYVLNCGPECGGTAASVTVLDMTANPPVAVSNIPVPAATVGLLNGNNLFVAGTPGGTPGALAGRLSVLDTTALAPPASPVPISDGYHNLMELASNNKLFIGAAPTCTAGCLTIFDTSNGQAAVDGTTGNVTGIAPINGRNVAYVVEDVAAGSSHCQGQLPCLGKLRIYDTTASTPTLTPTQIDVTGKAVDVKYVDQ
jgi:DNA-binding beta-propeller fold protein YncE